MSTYDPVIDPALADEPAPRKAKRKASAPRPEPVRRTTRRSVASGAVVEEPSRGEEENLMGYEYGQKRSRRRSPSMPVWPSTAAAAAAVSAAAGGHHGTASAHASARASARQSPQQSVQPSLHPSRAASPRPSTGAGSGRVEEVKPRYPYPFGMTPYRFACLHPETPAPAPADPKPGFIPFDAGEAAAFHATINASMAQVVARAADEVETANARAQQEEDDSPSGVAQSELGEYATLGGILGAFGGSAPRTPAER